MADHPKHATDTDDVTPLGEEGGASPGPSDPTPALADELTDLRRERDGLYDRLLRQAAEFDNYRKRIDRERREASEYAAVDLLQELLPILDDFERALALQPEAAPGTEKYRQGMEIIHRELTELLRKRGVTAIDAIGTDFDPHVHQAVVYEPAPESRDGEVIGEFRRGYRLGDRLLRPAMVKVAKV